MVSPQDMDDLLGWLFWMIDLVCLMMLLMDVLFVDGYLLQDALVLEFPGGPCMNEQRKDDHGNRKGVRPTYGERPLLSLRDIPNTQAIAKQTKQITITHTL